MNRIDYTPRPYGEEALRQLWMDPAHALFHDPGLGKTALILEAYRQMLAACEVSRLLVVAPLRVCISVWPGELAKWKNFKGLTMQHFRDRKTELGDANITLVHPEAFPSFFGKRIRASKPGGRSTWRPGAWSQWDFKPDMFYIDESHHFKRASGVRFRTIERYFPAFGRRSIGTGSFCANGAKDLHGQIKLLDDGAILGRTQKYFYERWFDEKPTHRHHVMKYEPKDGATDEIMKLIKPRVHCLRAEDHLELPDLMTIERTVKLSPRVRKEYEQVRKYAIMEIEQGGKTVVFDKGAAAGKLRQIANGHVYVDGMIGERTNNWAMLHTEKLEALKALIEEIGEQPTLVIYQRRCDRDAIQSYFAGDIPCIGGGTTSEQQLRYERRWNAGEIPLMLMFPQEGLNIQDGGNHIIWYGVTDNLQHYDQTIRRLVRSGQTADTVFNYHLIAECPVERRISHVLSDKNVDANMMKAALVDSIYEEE